MPPTELSHQEFVELVTEYLEGALPPAQHARFERHAAACSVCAAFIEELRMTIRLVGKLKTESIPEEMWQPLLVAFRGWKRSRGGTA